MHVDEAAATIENRINLNEIKKLAQEIYDNNCKKFKCQLTNAQNTSILLENSMVRLIQEPKNENHKKISNNLYEFEV